MKHDYPMYRYSLFRFALCLLLVVFSATASAQQEKSYHDGVVRIKVTEELAAQLERVRMARSSDNVLLTGIAALDNISSRYKVDAIKRVFRHAGKFEAKHRKYGLHLWYEVHMEQAAPVLEALSAYMSLSNVQVAEPVYKKVIIGSDQPGFGPVRVEEKNLATLPGTSNDPLLPQQWHYNNTSQTGGRAGADISLLKAWELETGNSQVIVAVTDGGIQTNHPDLAANMWVNEDEIPGNGIDDDNNGYIDDVHGYGFGDNTGTIAPDGHGTHVGGTVAATTNNGIGVAGVAGGSGVGDGARLMSCAAFGANANGGFAETYTYAADNGALISQNSWGYSNPGVYEQAVLDGIDYFIAEAGRDENGNQVGLMSGGIVIFAAGNDDLDEEWYPGFYEAALTVSGLTHNDTKAWYSNFGTWVDIAAPGGETDNVPQHGVLSTLNNSQYGFYQGTSMACPHVSGVAALIISKFGGPGFTPDLVRARLVQTVDDVDSFDPPFAGLLGSGRLNAFAALQENDGAAPEPIDDLSVAAVDITSVTLAWTAPEDEGNASATYYDIRYSTSPITEANFDSAAQVADPPKPSSAGEQDSVTVTGLSPATTYYFAIKSADFFGNYSSISNVVEQTTNHPPVIVVQPSSLSDTLLTAETSTQFLTIANDGLGELDFVILSLEDTAFTTLSADAGTIAPGDSLTIDVTLDASGLFGGVYEQELIILSNDPDADTLTVPVTLYVINNDAPIASVSPDTVNFGSVFQGAVVEEEFTISNEGSEPLIVEHIESSNPSFTTDFADTLVVEPFSSVSVTVIYTVSSLGSEFGTLTLHTNDSDSSNLTVYLHGEGVDAPGIVVNPSLLEETLITGDTAVHQLVIENTGGSELEFFVSISALQSDSVSVENIQLPMPSSSTMSMTGMKQKGKAASLNAAREISLKSVRTYATSSKVLILSPDDNLQDLAAILNSYDDIDAEIFPKASLASITLADVIPYDVIITSNNSQWLGGGGVAPSVIGDLLADYIDAGGKVIANQFVYSYDAWRLEGRFIDEQYGPFIPSTTDADVTVTLGSILAPSHPVMEGVQSIEYSGFVQNVSLAPGATALANWDNNELFAAANNNVVALNLLPSLGNGGPLQWSGDLPTFYHNAIHWLAGPSFVYVLPEQGTVAPGEQLTLDVIFDAVGLNAGEYRASLDINTNVPSFEVVSVPAVLTVIGPEFSVTPDSLYVEVEPGEVATRTLTLTNEGQGTHSFEVTVRKGVEPLVSKVSQVSAARQVQETLRREPVLKRTTPFDGRKLDSHGTSALRNASDRLRVAAAIPMATSTLYETEFEQFTPGDIHGQDGWAGQFGNWIITTAEPFSGAQHLQSEADGLGQTLAFSPEVAIGTEPVSTTTMKLNIEGGGVTWQVIPQSTTEALVNTRLEFSPDGSVRALVSDGAGGGEYQPVATSYPAGYFDLTIEVNRETSAFSIYFDDELVFTGQGFAGNIEQVVFLSLMEASGSVFNVDNFKILDGKNNFMPDYMDVTPLSGELAPGESVEITITYDATDLAFGTYPIDVVINVADVQELLVPTLLNVVGERAIEVEPTVLQVTVPYQEDTVEHIEIRNTGGRPLDYSLTVIGADTDVSNIAPAAPSRFMETSKDRSLALKIRSDEEKSVKQQKKESKPLQLYAGVPLFQEDFEGGTFPPAGWEIVDNEGAGVVWGFAADYGEGNYAGTGEAATVSSDAAGEAEFDTELITPVITLGEFRDIVLQYNVNYQNFQARDFLNLDIRTNTDTTWTNILSWNEDHGTLGGLPGEFVSLELAEYLEGAESFQLRWHYFDPQEGDFDWYAQIDDIVILGNPQAWLTVTPSSGTIPVNESVEVDAYFNAEELDPGMYVAGILVNSNAARTPLVGIVASMTVLAPPVIEITPDSIYQELMYGDTATQVVTISNDGPSPLKFTVNNKDITVEAVAKKDVARIEPVQRRTSATIDTTPLDDKAAIITKGASKLAASELYATTFEEFTLGDISGQQGWSGQWGNWTIESDNPYSGSNHFRGLSDGLGRSLAFSPEVAIGSEQTSSTSMMINADQTEGSTWQVIPQSITAALVITRVQLTPEGNLEALVSDGAGGGSFQSIPASLPTGWFELGIEVNRESFEFIVYINGESVFTGIGFSGDIEQVVWLSEMEADGPVFDMDDFAILDGSLETPWLTFSPTSGVIPQGGSADVVVSFNATEVDGGIYADTLNIISNDPERPVVSVPVVLYVIKNQPPVVDVVSDTSVVEQGVLELTFTATDPDNENVNVYLADSLDFATITASSSGSVTYRFSPALGDAGQYELTVVAVDSLGAADSTSFSLTVESYGVSHFTLVNILTNEVITTFEDSLIIDVADRDFLKYALVANTKPAKVGSVVFKVDGKKINVENEAPYQMNWLVIPLLSAGDHTLTAESFTGSSGRGDAGSALTARITIINSATVTKFELVNLSGKVLSELQDGDVINIKDPMFRSFNIIARTTSGVGSVRFDLNGRYYRMDNLAPFSLSGDLFGYFLPWPAKPGQYTLKVTPYSQPFGLGVKAEPVTISFTIVNGNMLASGKSNKGAREGNELSEVSAESRSGGASVYPVPVRDQMSIEIGSELKGEAEVTIYNVHGQIIYRGMAAPGVTTLLAADINLKRGVYYVHINGNGFRQIKKIIKE